MDNYKFQIFQYPQNKTNNILDCDFDTTYGTSIAKPNPSLGFIHFIHRTKDKMEILYTDKLRGKKFYLVT